LKIGGLAADKYMNQKASYKISLDSLPALAQQNKEKKNGISIISTDGEKQGSNVASELLYEITDNRTALFLSGGKTPVNLYSELGKEQNLKIGAAAMVDERYGKPMHDNSNELMIERSRLPDYFEREKIPFYRILVGEQNIANTAFHYDETVRYLLSHFPKSVAILGIGEDGHIAGIAPNRSDFINPLFSKEQRNLLVSYFKDPKSGSCAGNPAPLYGFGQRVTMTIRGLSKMDALIVLAIGEKKKAALSRLFKKGPIKQVPSRFVKNKIIASKTILITDQKV